MKIRFIAILIAWLVLPLTALAQKYSASFHGDSPTEAIALLKKVTGYDFVYQKDLLKDLKVQVIGEFREVTMQELLDYTVQMQMGLDFKIVDKTVTLRPATKSAVNALVRGEVVDEEGEPLPGATVSIMGTNFGTATNVDGEFSLEIHSNNPVVEVYYVGMNPQQVRLTPEMAKKNVRIVMKRNYSMMDEVVVTGYQNIKRENATGAYTILSSEDLEKRHTTNLVNNLEGNIPGVVKQKDSRFAQGEDQLTIRGQGTFEARKAPLVVVDGLPIEGGMNTVNPYEVESITVLKDASAAAIYGARASNGVIVITTKSARKEKISIDFNADITITDKLDYNKGQLANAAQVIELERLNWNAMRADDDQSSFTTLLSNWNRGGFYAQGTSPVKRLFIRNYLGELSDSELNSTLDEWSRNDYRKEWMDATQRTRVNQQYNVALRTQGKTVNSNIVLNYTNDNMGLSKEYSRALQFRYRGDMKITKWFDLAFSVNVLSQRSKTDAGNGYSYGDYNAYAPYETMFNPDGSLKPMEAGCILSNPALSNPDYELKDHSYNLLQDQGLGINKDRYTNIRAYVHADFKLPVEGWKASGQFQYEDIQQQYETLYDKTSYMMRDIYNLYTTVDRQEVWVDDPFWDFDDWDGDIDHAFKKPIMMDVTNHHVPDGAMKTTNRSSGNFYTFRAQTDYNRTFLGKHEVSALAGFEFREVHTRTSTDMRLGYDPLTMTNQIPQTDWAFINGWGKESILGPGYGAYGIYSSFGDTDVLHRYYSYYFTGNYVYDSRYSVFGSYRVDKTDLFGSDPKFRGRPLWSVGASWNAHNEAFMSSLTWLDALKLRLSYGLTGNIDPNSTSYLTARIRSNGLNGQWQGEVDTPPNDQLRWEKTSTWNGGIDFAFLGYRLNGSIDLYRKSGSDLLTDVALDCTTGVPGAKQKLNAGCMVNRGIEFQLQGRILQQRRRSDVGVSITANFGYNKNKVTKVYFHPTTGYDFRTMELLEGYPLNSMISLDYAGLVKEDKMIYGTWRDHNGEVHNTSTSSADFTIEDCIFSGTTTPKWTGGFTPEVKWNGFTLTGMFSFYGGHVMRVSPVIWNTTYGYNGQCPVSALDYWNGVEGTIPNGYQTKYLKNGTVGAADFRNVEKGDYMKFRSLVLTYDFDQKLIRRIGLNDLRLRLQMDNVHTWVANSAGWDPEGTTLVNGRPMKQPRSYTMSLYFNL